MTRLDVVPWAFLTLVLVGLLAAAFHAGRMYEREEELDLGDGLHALEEIHFQRKVRP